MWVKVRSDLWEKLSEFRSKKGDLMAHVHRAVVVYNAFLKDSLAVLNLGEIRALVDVEELDDIEGYLLPVSEEFSDITIEKVLSRFGCEVSVNEALEKGVVEGKDGSKIAISRKIIGKI